MAEVDFMSQGMNAIWTALEGYTRWADLVAPKNRLKYIVPEATKTAQAVTTSSDSPACWVVPTSFTDVLFTDPETFSTYDDGFDPATSEWLETITVEYQINIRGRTIKIGESDILGIRTLQALRKAGPRLGQSFIMQVGKVTGLIKEVERNDQLRTYRFDTVIRVPIQMQFEGASLTT